MDVQTYVSLSSSLSEESASVLLDEGESAILETHSGLSEEDVTLSLVAMSRVTSLVEGREDPITVDTLLYDREVTALRRVTEASLRTDFKDAIDELLDGAVSYEDGALYEISAQVHSDLYDVLRSLGERLGSTTEGAVLRRLLNSATFDTERLMMGDGAVGYEVRDTVSETELRSLKTYTETQSPKSVQRALTALTTASVIPLTCASDGSR